MTNIELKNVLHHFDDVDFQAASALVVDVRLREARAKLERAVGHPVRNLGHPKPVHCVLALAQSPVFANVQSDRLQRAAAVGVSIRIRHEHDVLLDVNGVEQDNVGRVEAIVHQAEHSVSEVLSARDFEAVDRVVVQNYESRPGVESRRLRNGLSQQTVQLQGQFTWSFRAMRDPREPEPPHSCPQR